ncbi:MAG: hypothetical protein M1823_005347 [Watsoniomyces obsoletus]|nr:MAG: hypothetical protein M1823_005347 [Watsoniomyces obsoletus]
MERLSNELLRDILDFIQVDPDHVLSVDRRAYLSVESFKAPSPPLPAQAHDVASFRLVCRRFAELGAPYQFTRVTTRFSEKGFKRLDGIAESPRIARHVKKFSYMIPCFYLEGKDHVEELFHALGGDLNAFDACHFQRKAEEQKTIVTSKDDFRILKKALSAFTSLQHVQILRLQDEPDRLLLDHLREEYEAASEYVDLQWTPACVHGTTTMSEALVASGSSFTRFSGPMMNPQSVLEVQRAVPQAVSDLARQLTCLELHFDETINLDERMRSLSGMFKEIFTAARGMLAVHLGFPSRAPLRLGLEEIFHDVQWERLRAFGIQAWRLDAEEIIGLVRRHRKTLRGLRLRDVLLKEPSRWTTVLDMLRNEVEYLDWVSLRRIGYARTFDQRFAGTMEVLPDPPGGASESDDEEEFPTHLGAEHDDAGEFSHDDDGVDVIDNEDHGHDPHEDDHHHENEDTENDPQNDTDDDTDDDEDEEHGPEAHELAMDPDTPSSIPWCNCARPGGGGSHSTTNNQDPVNISMSEIPVEALGDNGREVENWQRKMWERWVLGRPCPEHQHQQHQYQLQHQYQHR